MKKYLSKYSFDDVEKEVIEEKDIVSVFTTENGVDTLFEQLASEVRSEVPDLTTKKGRDRIASLAYKVGKAKEREVILIDEFTSVVDRDVAKTMSNALQKYIRKQNKKIIILE